MIGGVLERLQLWQSQRVADPAFRRWAQAFWPTRWVARRRARELFDIVAGFVYSQVLLACVQLRLFDRLAQGPVGAAELARTLRLAPDAATRLLDAATALRLLTRLAGARYGLGPLGAAMVGNDGVAAMVEHHGALYADLRDPLALLRGELPATALGAYWPYARGGKGATPADGGKGATPADGAKDASAGDDGSTPAAVAAYSALMAASQPLVADEVLDAAPLLQHSRCLLDVGGGEGVFLAAAARRHPRLRLMLFDLPPVAALARRRLDASGFGQRADCSGGDFLRDPLPRGADVISLVRVVHDHDDAAVRVLLRAVHDALPAGGRLLLAEPMAATPGATAMGDAYFGIYLYAMGSGRPRSAAGLTALLREAGFRAVHQRPTRMPLQTGLLVADKAAVNVG